MRARLLIIVAVMLTAPILAKTPNTKSELPAQPGWEQISYWPAVGKVDVRKEGLFIVDKRPVEPAKALAACRVYGADPVAAKVLTHGAACEIFLYPSARKLAGANEAVAIYDRQFAIARSAADRISIAIDLNLGVEWELTNNATADALNDFVESGNDGRQMTAGEKYASQNAWKPEHIQWLYDHGARLCELDAPQPAKRFSCIEFYLNSDSVKMSVDGADVTSMLIGTLDILEKNGFRPKSRAEIEAAVSWSDVVGSDGPGKRRFYALLTQPDARRVADIAKQRRNDREAAFAAEQRANQERERQNLIKSTGPGRRSEAENKDAVRRVAVRGETVCQLISDRGKNYVFRAVVEGNSATRLQLRAASIRSSNGELTGYPYGDTRIDAGILFWDDAANWSSDC